jgi:DNA-binding GntR family transcriptional regulator
VTLSPNDPRPPYLQIADDLRSAIRRGELPSGAQLPSINELVERYGVARNTVRSALRVLSDEQLIVARQGSGAFVRSELPETDSEATPAQMEEIMRQVGDLAQSVERLGQRLADLENLVRKPSPPK